MKRGTEDGGQRMKLEFPDINRTTDVTFVPLIEPEDLESSWLDNLLDFIAMGERK